MSFHQPSVDGTHKPAHNASPALSMRKVCAVGGPRCGRFGVPCRLSLTTLYNITPTTQEMRLDTARIGGWPGIRRFQVAVNRPPVQCSDSMPVGIQSFIFSIF